ncbi:hypothetical protein GO684_02080 [Wolbachia endosymbiont of Litomosoides brasiliensis]|uniref:hypothetical protein n=1 Tax=Wolbachia endosymbiont of Litomosoides brasiliensis TaxID=1812117 RepID=UPI00158919AD|nr:hypothetical protein [Wolbachia endosymbiont of Litomosoides brasiliensis]NUY39478.1 hypothetical protein [Wolbachia endosymbiont of Litomosoides brasiliensis]
MGKRGDKFAQGALKQSNCIIDFITQKASRVLNIVDICLRDIFLQSILIFSANKL